MGGRRDRGEDPGGLLPGEPRGIPEISEPEASIVGVSAHHASCRPHPVYTGLVYSTLSVEKDDNKIISR